MVVKVSEQINRQNNTAYNNKFWGDAMYNAPVYGVVPGGTDVTDKLQALIDMAIEEGRRAIYFPAGEYYVTSLTGDDQVDFFGDNASFTGGYTGAIRQMGDWASTAQLAEIEQRLSVDVRAIDFGIVANTGEYIDEEKLSEFFAFCEDNNGRAVFDSGIYKFSGYNYQIPMYGIKGKGRRETVLELPNVPSGEYGFKYGELNQWQNILGDIEELYIKLPDDSEGNNLFVSTPSRNFKIESVGFKVGKGNCLTLENTFYLHCQDVLFEGPFQEDLPTSLDDMLVGRAIYTPNITPQENNNITFTKCDFRYLSEVWRNNATVFQGSNAISFLGCAIEYIGDCVFRTLGMRIHADTVYFEMLDRNRDVTGRPNESTKVLMVNGGGMSVFSNCLVNLSGVRSNSYMIQHVIGSVTFNGGSVTNKPTGYVMIEPTTFSSRGVIVDNDCQGLAQNWPSYERWEQRNTMQYPLVFGQEMYAGLITESKYAKNTLYYQSMASPTTFTFNAVQPITSVEGRSDTGSHLVEIDVTLYRFLPAEEPPEVGWKHLILRFLINPDMPSTITPDIEEVSSGGNQDGFSDTNILTKIKAARRTPARTDMDNPYSWHYQVYIDSEDGGATARILANRVKANIIWIAAGARDTLHPNYSIYPQSHTFGNAI